MKKVTLIICIAVMLIPTVLAIFLYKAKAPEIVKDTDNVDVIAITDSNGKTFTVTDKDEIKFLGELANTKNAVTSVPDEVLQYKTFLFKFDRGEESVSYTFFMSAERIDAVYFKDREENYYHAEELKARSFMETEYAVSLYDTDVPTLKVGAPATLITPYEMSWSYKTSDGNFKSLSVPTSSEVVNVDIISKKTLDIEFSQQPSNVVMSVFNGDEQIGSYILSDFSGISSIKEAKYYKIKLEAKWESFGSASYQFNAYLLPDSEFTVTETSLRQGGVLGIKINNAKAEKIKFKCEPEINVSPVFYESDDVVVGLLPTNYDTKTGDYKITVSFDDTVFTADLRVTEYPREFNTKYFRGVSEEEFLNVFSKENLQKENDFITDIINLQTASKWLCEGETLANPIRQKEEHSTGYGVYYCSTEKNANKGVYYIPEGEEAPVRHDGVDFGVSKGTKIKAALSGTVIYAEADDFHGGLIVIDHGNGLRTWYSRVEISVSAGDTVKQGDVIAKSDNSGFGDVKRDRMHFAVSVGETFISPDIALNFDKLSANF